MLAADRDPSPTDIAIVGMSGRFPGARNIAQFWQNLCKGIESSTPLSEQDLLAAGIPASLLADSNYVRVAYLMEDVDCFDAASFGYSPREARFIDPQQRVLLECAYHALEDAGYARGEPLNAGVYVGCSLNTYLLHTGLSQQFSHDPVLTLMSNDKDFLATRIGYQLDLRGPCVTVQSACSTSLVAVHMASQSLLARECDMGLAGGVCVRVPLLAGYLHREGGMLSADGHCRPFDAAATGTIFGSGAGMVVLKRLADALADRDTIHAVMKGSAINNDGHRKASYTAPSVVGIAEALHQAIDFAAVEPGRISYVECHGTGTALGDPIEIHAMTKVFRASTARERFCAIGSVKSNIGHLESASGVAGLIKTVCCLKQRYLPPTAHFKTPNPALALDGSPFFVNEQGRAWVSPDGPRLAAVNSLGVGGTNASVILQEAAPVRETGSLRRWHMLPVSARTPDQLHELSQSLTELVGNDGIEHLADAAYTLHVGRRASQHRDAMFAAERGGLIRTPRIRDSTSVLNRKGTPPVIYVFGGENDSSLETIFDHEPAARQILKNLQAEFDKSLVAIDGGERFLALSKVFLTRLVLARLWSAWGVSAQHGVGDAIGAVVLACASGALSILSALGMLREFTDGRLSLPDLVDRSLRASADAHTAAVPPPYLFLPPPYEVGEIGKHLLDRYAQAIFLPLGTDGATLRALGSSIESAESYILLQPLSNMINDTEPPDLLKQAAALWTLGATFNGAALYATENRRRISLPPTPFLAIRHWF